MKKVLALILIFSLAVLPLCGCSNFTTPSSTTDDNRTTTNSAPSSTTDNTHTTTNSAPSSTTNGTHTTTNSIPSVTTDNTRTAFIRHDSGTCSIYLSLSNNTLMIDERYEAYIPYISEDLIRKAELILTEAVIGQERHSGIYLSKDREGCLCLAVEIIVSLTPPPDINYPGCGIDHDHVFHRERISTQPIQ